MDPRGFAKSPDPQECAHTEEAHGKRSRFRTATAEIESVSRRIVLLRLGSDA